MNDMVATESQGHPAPGAKSQHELAEMIRDRGSRTSSGPADISAAPTGRTYDRSRPNRSERQKNACQKGAVHIWRRNALKGRDQRPEIRYPFSPLEKGIPEARGRAD